jgi:L,D-peptidoglycan transpeptidase YkuD (ErfK/YbiS/YcfS/YnhG family)
MIRAQLQSPWTGDGQSPTTAYRPKIAVDYALASCVQVQAANPPAALTVLIVCTDDVWTEIQADAAYNQAISWSEEF